MAEEKQKLRAQKGKLRKQEKTKYNDKQENKVTDSSIEKLAVG